MEGPAAFRAPSWRAAACLCLLLGACRRDANANLEHGDRLLALGQHKQAIVEFQTALNLEPNAHAERGLGLAYESLAAYAQAQRHLEAALEAKPSDLEAGVALARVFTRFGKYEKARAQLSTILARDPDCDAALFLFGVYAETRPEVQQAIDNIDGYIARQRRLGHSISHEAELVLADLMARINQAEAADKLRENIRYAPLGNSRLTLELAHAAADRDNHDLARQLLLPLVERHPNEIDAWQVLASSALELGQIAGAREAMKHLGERAREPEVRLLTARLGLASGLETAPTNELLALLADTPRDQEHARARIRRYLADALSAQRQYDAAEGQLSALLAEHPQDVEGSLALAELQLGRGKYEQAAQVVAALTEHHGRLARAYAVLGRAHLGNAQLEAAEEAFRRLWELAPHEGDSRHWLAITLRRRGQADQARRLLEGNLKRFPTHAASLRTLLALLEESPGRGAARLRALSHGQDQPESPEIADVEAGWLMAHGDTEHALAAYRRALVLNPSFYPAVLSLSHFYARHDKSGLARSVIDGALGHSPNNLELYLLAARTASDLRRYDDAREYCERALAESAEHPLVLAELASVYAEGFRDLGRAKQLVERAQKAAPSRPEVLDAVGWVTHLGGESAAAIGQLQSAAELDSANPRPLYHLGAALLGAGQFAAANEKFAGVLRLDPLFPTANEIRLLLARR